MTQAYNLSQLANNLNTSGQLDAQDGLVNAVPVANGGTGASDTTSARNNLDVPSKTGTGATGTWAIGISGTAATATTATTVSTTVASGATGTTQAAGDNSTKIATTAFVTSAVNAASTYGGIGSYVIAFYPLAQNAVVAANANVNGSDLYKMTDPPDSSNEFLGLAARASGSVAIVATAANVESLGLTGTWRVMTRIKNANNSAGTVYVIGMFVRIS